MQGIQQTKMLVERRREALFQQLDLSGLERVVQGKARGCLHALLAEYHDIFCLEPGELGFTNLVKHMKSDLLVLNLLKSGSGGFPHP